MIISMLILIFEKNEIIKNNENFTCFFFYKFTKKLREGFTIFLSLRYIIRDQ